MKRISYLLGSCHRGAPVNDSRHLARDTVTFGVLVLGAVVLVGALSFLPALVLGPIVELLQS